MFVCGRGSDTVNQPKSIINANMHLHTVVPFTAFFNLMYFRIALTFCVLGLGRRRNNGGIYDGPLAQMQTLIG